MKKGPEKLIQEAIERMFRAYGWYILRTHGSMYQSGFPDDYVTHSRYGARWVEVKDPTRTGEIFTPAQLDTFPKLCANGAGVWVLTMASDLEYQKVFDRPNWIYFLSAFKDMKGLSK